MIELILNSKMYSKIRELNVPTWVVGREREITLSNGKKTGEAISMKIWPNKENPEIMICHSEKGLPEEVAKNPQAWVQEEDVLDTWFSSALWPLTTLGWPDNSNDFNTFYPTSTLITGHDILFFWVARMILMGEYATGKVPFKETFIHGLIYGKSYWRVNPDGNIAYVSSKERLEFEKGEPQPKDVFSKWEKMSKSKGNVIDPIEVIAEYGTDAMRFALTSTVTHARQIDLDRRRFEEYKNFANKLWNATRYIVQGIDDLDDLSGGLDYNLFTLDDKWILSRLESTIAGINHKFTNYIFSEAAKEIYEFFWDEFCAYYLELSKPYLFSKTGTKEVRTNKQKILLIVLMASIRLMHPIVPFITEEIFSLLKERFKGTKDFANQDIYTNDLLNALSFKACIIAPFPEKLEPSHISSAVEEEFSKIAEVIYALRNIRAELQIPPGTQIDVHISSEEKEKLQLILNNKAILHALIRIRTIESTPSTETSGATAIANGIKLFVPLPIELKEKEKSRLIKELEKLDSQKASLKQKLQNPDFTARAPADLVAKTQKALIDTESAHTEIKHKLNALSSIT